MTTDADQQVAAGAVPLNGAPAPMGHRTPMMTRRYDDVHPEQLQRAVRALAAVGDA